MRQLRSILAPPVSVARDSATAIPLLAIVCVYSGTNALADVDILRGDLFGILPIQGVLFLLLVIIFGFLLKFTSFGRYVYAIGGNEQAARVAGIRVDAVKITVYALSGALSVIPWFMQGVFAELKKRKFTQRLR